MPYHLAIDPYCLGVWRVWGYPYAPGKDRPPLFRPPLTRGTIHSHPSARAAHGARLRGGGPARPGGVYLPLSSTPLASSLCRIGWDALPVIRCYAVKPLWLYDLPVFVNSTK